MSDRDSFDVVLHTPTHTQTHTHARTPTHTALLYGQSTDLWDVAVDE